MGEVGILDQSGWGNGEQWGEGVSGIKGKYSDVRLKAGGVG